MANCYGMAQGVDKNRTRKVTFLGSEGVEACATTRHTFVTVEVQKDGSGHVEVERDGLVLHEFAFGPEEVV